MKVSKKLKGKSTSLGSFCKLFTNRGLFSNILPGGSVFICIAPKARAQYNEELTCGIELLCLQICAMGCYSCSGATTFGQTFSSVCSVDQLERYCAMLVGATLCSNALGTMYCAITTGAIHAYITPPSPFHPHTLSSTLFLHLSKFLSLYITSLLIFFLVV